MQPSWTTSVDGNDDCAGCILYAHLVVDISKPSEEITLRDAVETIEPVICIKDCVNDPESCSLRKGECAVHRAFNGIQREFIKALESRNFKELAEETYQECKYNK